MAAASRPRGPNILITGTPGTGKTTLSEQLAEKTGLQNISIAQVAKDSNLYDGYDENLDCPYLDEDRVLDDIEDRVKAGGTIVEYHGSDFFPKRWFDIIFVLRTNTSILYDRLNSRGYSDVKRDKNVECEIFQVLLDEAKEAYDPEIVHELPSNTPEEMEENLERIQAWIQQWKNDNGQGD